jgi:hypothetical protein
MDDPKIEVLRAQLELMRDNDKRVLETVRTCAGLLACMAALLVGYGWWNNKINNERERETVRRDLETGVHEAESKLRGEIAEKLGKLTEEQTKLKSEITESLNTKNIELATRVNAAFLTLNSNNVKQLNEILASNRKAVDENLDRVLALSAAGTHFEQAFRLAKSRLYTGAVDSFAYAGAKYLATDSDVNALKCLTNIEDYLPFVRERDVDVFREMESSVTNLLSVWRKRDSKGIYADRFKQVTKMLTEAASRK